MLLQLAVFYVTLEYVVCNVKEKGSHYAAEKFINIPNSPPTTSFISPLTLSKIKETNNNLWGTLTTADVSKPITSRNEINGAAETLTTKVIGDGNESDFTIPTEHSILSNGSSDAKGMPLIVKTPQESSMVRHNSSTMENGVIINGDSVSENSVDFQEIHNQTKSKHQTVNAAIFEPLGIPTPASALFPNASNISGQIIATTNTTRASTMQSIGFDSINTAINNEVSGNRINDSNILDIIKVAEVSNSLGFKVFRLAEPYKNVLISPLSLSTSLSIIALGANGKTFDELINVLELRDLIIDDFFSGIRQLWMLFFENNDTKNNALHTINQCFVDSAFKILNEFVSTIRNYYNASVHYVAMRNNAADFQITDVTKGDVSLFFEGDWPQPSFVVYSATYVHQFWDLSIFDSTRTHPAFFYNDGVNQTIVQMMTGERFVLYKYHRDLDSYSLLLPCRGSDISILFLLPFRRRGLFNLERKITSTRIHKIIDDVKTKFRIRVSIPKFELDEVYDMVTTFQSLGVRDAFNRYYADLSKASNYVGFHVSNIVQQQEFRIQENETSVPTLPPILGVAGPPDLQPKPRAFYADHPFLFCLIDVRTKAVLFIGRIQRL